MKRLAFLGLVGLIALAGAVVLNQWYDEPDAAPAAKPEAAHTPERPNVGTVRVNEAGDTVVAGHAPPNAHVRIMVAGKLAGIVTADERGDWVFVPQTPLAPGAQEIGVEAQLADGRIVTAEGTKILFVPKKE